jgi:chloramphenicol-sensitive protein RarD
MVKNSQSLGLFFAAAMAFFFALEYFIADFVFQNFSGISALALNFWGFVGSVLFGSVVFLRKKTFRSDVKKTISEKGIWLFILAVLPAISSFLFLFGVANSDSGITSLLNRADALFAALFGFLFLHERFGKWELIAFVTAFLGIILISGLRGQISIFIALVILFATLLTALHSLLVKRFFAYYDAVVLTFLRCAFIVILTAPVLFFFEHSFIPPDPLPLMLIFLSGILGSFISRIFYFRACQITDIGKVHLVALLEPIFVLFGSIAFLGAEFGFQKFLGAFFVLIGLFFSVKKHLKIQKSGVLKN